ncbi:MAG: dCTP deaminase [Alphaproteobacteria bacterium]|nr:dCTP deaminase [Alphaproteobacteria bacterium]
MITVDPAPPPDAYSSTSIDLTLDPLLSIFKDNAPGIEQIVDPASATSGADSIVQQLTEKHEIGEAGRASTPRRLVLAWTREYVNLKFDARLAARVEGKSSLSRLGLAVHVTAPTIHSGFDGRIRLEIINHGPLPIRLRSGMRICQLIFEQTLGTPERGYRGQFSGQSVG